MGMGIEKMIVVLAQAALRSENKYRKRLYGLAVRMAKRAKNYYNRPGWYMRGKRLEERLLNLVKNGIQKSVDEEAKQILKKGSGDDVLPPAST